MDSAGLRGRLMRLATEFDADEEYVRKGDWLHAHTRVDRIFRCAERVFLIGKSNWQKYRAWTVMRYVLIAGFMCGIAFR
ncbi:MAG: hypothetical protein CMP98_02445 [Gammaproteobacteria bacterium]|nr:hypothetical protein [Gammaproteobacteria bacterium]OUU11385.1 MAG: hypothetical protein CBB94_02550 [Gammaproteobacteria bacterium TMED34]